MDKLKQRYTIGKFCGWVDCLYYWEAPQSWKTNAKFTGPPEYLERLDAMHEAEKLLTEEQWKTYCIPLGGRNIGWDGAKKMLHATAEQKAEAFLKAVGLWEE